MRAGIIVLVAAAIMIAGFVAYRGLPLDALPDLSDTQIVVWAEWPGRSPEDVHAQVASRISAALQGMPGSRAVRATAVAGGAWVQAVFHDGQELSACRQRALERLAGLQGQLPPGASVRLAPEETALGQVYAFSLRGSRDLEARRRVLDQVVAPALRAIDGVAEVAPVGGMTREYQIDLDPLRLEEQGLTLDMLTMALQRSGRDVGAMAVERAGVDTMIRGVGALRSLADIEDVPIRGQRKSGAGLRLKDVATVTLGPAPRDGLLCDEHGEQVGAIVAARVGADPGAIIRAVRERLDRLAPTLRSEGLDAVAYYDRSRLISETRATLHHALWQELVVTALIVGLFLLHARTSLAVALALPFGIACTFLAMRVFGVGADIMSLAGIAVAIGVMVDMGIVIAENIHQRVARLQQGLARAGLPAPTSFHDQGLAGAVRAGAREVAPAIITATAATIVGFLPVFLLDDQAGRLFHPLAMTKTLAIAGSALFGLIVVPILCRLLLPAWSLSGWVRAALATIAGAVAGAACIHGVAVGFDQGRWSIAVPGWLAGGALAALVAAVTWRLCDERVQPPTASGIAHALSTGYGRLLQWALAHRRVVAAGCVALAASALLVGVGYARLAAPLRACITAAGGDLTASAPDRWLAATFPGLRRSFLPPLDEGGLLFMPSLLPHASLAEAERVAFGQNRRIAAEPEVESVMGKLGRAESPLDPAPTSMIETTIQLKPYALWPTHEIHRADGAIEVRARTLAEVRAALALAAEVPGVTPSWLQPIEARLAMLSTGIRSPLALQFSGDDGEALEAAALAASEVIARVPGAIDVAAQRESGKPYAEARLDGARLARYGLDREGLVGAMEVALGGMPVATTVEGNQRYGVRVRYARERRDDLDELPLMQIGQMVNGHGAITLSNLVSPPRVWALTFAPATGGDPERLRRALPIAVARALTIVSPTYAELTLPAGENLPAAVRRAEAAGELRVDGSRPQPSGLTWTVGPMRILSENGRRVAYVLVGAASGESDVAAAADRALAAALAKGTLTLPAGVSYRWVGRFEQQRAADRRLAVIAALALAAMAGLIAIGTRDAVATAIIIGANAPLALAGGILMVGLCGAELTVAVGVGFIAVLGTMCNNGILIATYLGQRFRDAPIDVMDVRARVLEGGLRRLRPALMTNAIAVLSLLPILWSDGRGAEVIRPMALPIIGGMTADLLSLLTVPCWYAWWRERSLARTLAAVSVPVASPAPDPAQPPETAAVPAASEPVLSA